MAKRNFTIGAFRAAAAQYEEIRAETVARFKAAAAARGSFLLTAVLSSLAAGFFVFCVAFGLRLGLGF